MPTDQLLFDAHDHICRAKVAFDNCCASQALMEARVALRKLEQAIERLEAHTA